MSVPTTEKTYTLEESKALIMAELDLSAKKFSEKSSIHIRKKQKSISDDIFYTYEEWKDILVGMLQASQERFRKSIYQKTKK